MAAAEGKKKMTSFTARSSDGEELEAEAAAAAIQPRTIRRAIDDDDNGILLPDALSKVIDYCNKHPAASDDTAPPSGGGHDNRDAGFAKVGQPTLLDLIPPSQRSASKIPGDRAAVNPAAADPPMPVPGLHHHPNIPAANRRLPPAARLLINCGIFLVATAGSFIVFHTAGDPSTIDNLAYALIAFLFVLLGVWFVLLGPVAGQFPGATRVAIAIARALKGYLLGGGN